MMELDEAIKRYADNAEYERAHGNLQGCLEFRQLAEWLKDYKRLLEQQSCDDAISRREVLDEIRTEIESKEMIETTIEPQFYNMALNDVLQIIDKYRAESEDAE